MKPMNEAGLLDNLVELLAERVAAKVSERLGDRVQTTRLLTVPETAKYLSRSIESVQHLVASGKVPTVRMDRRVYIDLKDLDLVIEQHKKAA